MVGGGAFGSFTRSENSFGFFVGHLLFCVKNTLLCLKHKFRTFFMRENMLSAILLTFWGLLALGYGFTSVRTAEEPQRLQCTLDLQCLLM